MFTPAESVRDVYGYDPFKAIIAPRPIGWISTVSSAGIDNLAPFSFFNAVGSDPNMLGFTSAGIKNTLSNCQETGEFVFNLVSANQTHAMNQTSAALEADVDEFDFAGLAKAASTRVRPPRVANAPAAIECKVVSVNRLKDLDGRQTNSWFVIGQVVGVHIDPDYVTADKRFDTAKAAAVSRCGYMDYMAAGEIFELLRP